MANAFKKGDVVRLRSGGPPMTIDRVPEEESYGSSAYYCRWFKGATADSGHYGEHLLETYVLRQMSPSEAAEWMLEQFEAKRFLYQEEAATHLLHLHDEALAYFDDGGNICVGSADCIQ